MALDGFREGAHTTEDRRIDYVANLQIKCLREFEVTIIMRRHSHDGAVAEVARLPILAQVSFRILIEPQPLWSLASSPLRTPRSGS